jgi:hypothetical protein
MVLDTKQFAASAGHESCDSDTARVFVHYCKCIS